MRRPLDTGILSRLGAGAPTADDCSYLLAHYGAALQRQIEANRRDATICSLGEHLAPGMPVRHQADAIRAAVRRYSIRWHRVDKFKQFARIKPGKSADDLLLELFQRTAGEPPVSAKQLHRILLSDCFNSDTSGQLPLSVDRDDGEIR